jgi:transcriptional regulator with XRE-family HTH domain
MLCHVTDTTGPDDEDKIFGDNLRHLREAKNIPQAELANLMRERGLLWHQQTVVRVESGVRSVRWREARALSEILGVTLERFLWTNAEAIQAVLVRRATTVLRERWHDTVLAVSSLLAARNFAETALATSEESEYERVRESGTELAMDLRRCDLVNAMSEGVARYKSSPET